MEYLIFAVVVVFAAMIFLAVFPNVDATLKRYLIILVGVVVAITLLLFLFQALGSAGHSMKVPWRN